MIFSVMKTEGIEPDDKKLFGIDKPLTVFAQCIGDKVLEDEHVPKDCSVNLLITDNATIREYNRDYRDIDRETDVLSFPNIDYDVPGEFTLSDDMRASYMDPDTGLICLGDMMISYEKVQEQAAEYGHSQKRELAFLIAHSMLHLCGYDHMEPDEEKLMISKQEKALSALGINRQ